MASRWVRCGVERGRSLPWDAGIYALIVAGQVQYVGRGRAIGARVALSQHSKLKALVRQHGRKAVTIAYSLDRRPMEYTHREGRLVDRLRPAMNKRRGDRPQLVA